MLDIEKSFFIQHWEMVVIVISIAYFGLRLRDNRNSAEPKAQRINDDDTIENEYQDDDENVSDGLSPSLEITNHIPFKGASKVLLNGANEFYDIANDRRSIRKFSRKPVNIEIVKKCIHAAGTAPSGAHTEPWTFCLIKR
jgi:iodotyrosine deiodinase